MDSIGVLPNLNTHWINDAAHGYNTRMRMKQAGTVYRYNIAPKTTKHSIYHSHCRIRRRTGIKYIVLLKTDLNMYRIANDLSIFVFLFSCLFSCFLKFPLILSQEILLVFAHTKHACTQCKCQLVVAVFSQEVVSLWFLGRYSSCFLWGSFKYCEISLQVFI